MNNSYMVTVESAFTKTRVVHAVEHKGAIFVYSFNHERTLLAISLRDSADDAPLANRHTHVQKTNTGTYAGQLLGPGKRVRIDDSWSIGGVLDVLLLTDAARRA